MVEVDERVVLVQPDCVDTRQDGPEAPVRDERVGITGERLVVRKGVNVEEVRRPRTTSAC